MRRTPTREEKLSDIVRISGILDKKKLSFPQYQDAGGKFSKGQIFAHGDTWGNLCAECGIHIDRRNKPIGDATYFDRLRQFIDANGRLPKNSERTLAGLNFCKSRWPTLNSFFSEAIDKGIVPPELVEKIKKQPAVESVGKEPFHLMKLDLSNQPPHDHRKIPPPPRHSLRRNPKWNRIDVPGIPYAPQDENAVIALFSILCYRGVIPWQILDINSGQGVDCICHDEQGNREIRVEFKLDLTRTSWNHQFEELDVVVCWNNKWHNFPKKVIELSSLLKKIEF